MQTRPAIVTRAVWGAVILLTAVGVGSSIARAVFLPDLVTRIDPIRERVLAAIDRPDPLAAERQAEARRVDARFAAHRGMTLLHILPGIVFLLLAPAQFSRRLRTRHLRVHRWTGRVLLVSAVLTVVPSWFFGIGMPYGGTGEAAATAVFSGLFLFALGRAFVAVRRKDIALHREWMLRGYAVAIGIASIRVVAVPLDIALTPSAYRPSTVFVLSLWVGWILTMAAAELWIRRTRPRMRSPGPDGHLAYRAG